MTKVFIGPRLRNGRTRMNKKRTSLKTKVERIINSDSKDKMFDVVGLNISVTTTGLVIPLSSGIPQGNASNNREGNSITPQSMWLRAVFKPQSAMTDIQLVRFLLIRDKENSGAGVAAPLDVIQNLNVHSPLTYNAVINKRFTVLKDEIQRVGYYSGDGYNAQVVNFKKKLSGAMNWTAAGAGSKGQLYLLIISDNVAGAASLYSYTSRLHYRG